jgi:hypothetical protein
MGGRFWPVITALPVEHPVAKMPRRTKEAIRTDQMVIRWIGLFIVDGMEVE